MNVPQVELNFYPEQGKSLDRLIAGAIKAGFLFEKEYNETYENAERLKTVVEENIQFLMTSLITKDGTDVLPIIAEYNLLCGVLIDDDFLWLLAKNSLTNRIIAGCEKQKLSESVVYRIRECIIAFYVLKSEFDV